MGRRITRKQLKKDDEFLSAAELIFRWISGNWRPLIAGIGAVCVVALLWWAASSWMRVRADDASLLLHQAVVTFEGEAAPESLVPAGDVDAAEQQFLQVVESYGRTDQADMARLYLARIALSRGETDEARPVLVALSRRHPDDVIGRLASFDLIKLRIGPDSPPPCPATSPCISWVSSSPMKTSPIVRGRTWNSSSRSSPSRRT